MRVLRALAIAGAILLPGAVPTEALAASTADLSVSVSGEPDPVGPGEATTWTITVRNLGPGEATGVRLFAGWGSDAVGISATTAQGTCTMIGGRITFSLGTIPNGESVIATVQTIGFGGDGPRISVSVESTSNDPVEGNNSARGEVDFEPGPPSSPPPVGTFCAPVGGVSTGGGGTAGSLGRLATLLLLAIAGLLAVAGRRAKRVSG
jgi:fermentation-respiration switch protein FrsA (DUF1100 family)